MRRAGFTLIELLVVIAIIAILAAILFPVFSRVIKKAEAASCLSNEKQLMLATLTYAHDWDSTLPPYVSPWYRWMEPYVQNVDMLFCPSQEQRNYGTPFMAGYIINGFWPTTVPWVGKTLDFFPYPTHFGLFADGKTNRGLWTDSKGVQYYTPDFTFAGALALYSTTDPPFYGSNNGFGIYGRHNGVCNVGFLDGHAQAVPVAIISQNVRYYFDAQADAGYGQSYP